LSFVPQAARATACQSCHDKQKITSPAHRIALPPRWLYRHQDANGEGERLILRLLYEAARPGPRLRGAEETKWPRLGCGCTLRVGPPPCFLFIFPGYIGEFI